MEYIHCIVIRGRKLNRLFVESTILADDSLIRTNHGAALFASNIGSLIAIHKTHTQGDTHYMHWVFAEQLLYRPYVDYISYHIDYTKSKPRRMLHKLIDAGNTVVIAQYTDYNVKHPVHILPQSPVVKAFKPYHSSMFTAWLDSENTVPPSLISVSNEDFDVGL